MAILGKSALAMWWDMSPDMLGDFEHWHAHEHFPERLGVPGFLRASRWRCTNGGEGVFVMYELRDHGVLSSAPYLARLNAPSPWSTRLMPHHRHMVRSQCHVQVSCGAAVARHALTIRLSPAPRRESDLRASIARLASEMVLAPGLVGMHLLQHEAPSMPVTQEQKIRGGDATADWVLVTCAYDAKALETLSDIQLRESELISMGAAPGSLRGIYMLSQSSTSTDVV